MDRRLLLIAVCIGFIFEAGLQLRTAQGETRIFLGLSTLNARVSPLWIAQEKGFFTKRGLETLLVLTRVSQPAIAALLAGEMQMVYGGSVAAIGAVAGGADLKILATISNRLTYDLVARPGISTSGDLRGKRVGVGSIGGSVWMGAMLGLENLGLDPVRDRISLIVVGDQTNTSQALQAGAIDAALLDGVFTQRLREKGFPVLAEFSRANIPFAGQGIVATRPYLERNPNVVENFLKALLEGIEFSLAPHNKPAVLKTIKEHLRLADAAAADIGYQDLIRGVESKPYPSIEGLRNVQRLMRIQNPKVAGIKIETLIDERIVRKIIDGSGVDTVRPAPSAAKP
ncbi:MAG TPA: ABC transporter substrate-binding protein [Candidatus Binatia bacterium]|jgi:NitT/TauT family transport system substrate-binding protein